MSTTDVERLIVSLEARTKAFENALARANATANRQAKAIESRFEKMNKGVSANIVGLSRGLVGAFAGSAIIQQFTSLSEAGTRINNTLKVAGLSGSQLDQVYKRLASSAKANGAPVETLATLYARAAQNQKELGVSSEDLLQFTDNVALALRVAGVDAQTASGALLQLGQALGSGTVHAEEFNSVLEGAPTIVRAVAVGLKEANGSVAQLKNLVVSGAVSSEAFFRAFEAGSVVLKEQAAGSTLTLAQASTNLETALIDLTREFNESTGASKNLAEGIDSAAAAIDRFDVSGFIDKISQAKGELDGFLQGLGNAQVFKDFNALIGATDAEGNILNPDVSAAKDKITSLEGEIKLLQERIQINTNLGFDNAEALARIAQVRGELAKLQAQASTLPAVVDGVAPSGEAIVTTTNGQMGGPSTRGGKRNPVVAPVSLKSYPVTPAKSASSRGSRGGGGSENEYQREIEQIKERTAATNAETAALSKVNPLVEDYGYAVEKARAQQDLLTAAQKAGVTVTPELQANIEKLADGYARASAESQKLDDQQDALRRSVEEWTNVEKDATKGFISDLIAGKSAAEALGGALQKIADKLLDMSIDSLFSGGGFGGILSSIFGGFGGGSFPAAPVGLYDSGGYTGAGGKNAPAGIVHKGEVVWSQKDVARAGGVAAVEAMRLGRPGYADGGAVLSPSSFPSPSGMGRQRLSGVHVTVGVAADQNGNLKPFVESVAQRVAASSVSAGLKHYDKKVAPQTAVRSVRDHQMRNG